MSVYKDEQRGTWYCMFRYNDWTGRQKRRHLILKHPQVCLRISCLPHFVLPLDNVCRCNFIHGLIFKIRKDMPF